MSTVLNSDTAILGKIKKAQYRHQIPALALLAVAFFANFFLSSFNMRYPSLTLAVIAMGWYMYVNACFRFRHKIVVPQEGVLLSPITGRVKSLKRSSDLYQLKINKSSLDLVEIRCPHESAMWDGNNLKLNYQETPLILRLEANELITFADVPMQPGNIIGMLVGGGTCSVNLPNTLVTDLKLKDICDAGQTALLI